MRLATRKAAKYRMQNREHDKYVTQDAFDKMQRKLKRLDGSLNSLAAEVTRTQEMGDLSENAAYQEAKFALRRTMSQIENLKQQIKDAEIIKKPVQSDFVQIGSKVTVLTNEIENEFEILGSHESNPTKGKISHLSPIGSALLNHKVGDKIEISVNGKKIRHEIISIK